MNNTFNIHRFGALIRQGVIHDYKMYLVSLIGFCGSLFIVLFVIHVFNGTINFRESNVEALYMFVFFIAGLLHAGHAFAGFRSKEKSIAYLMNPASRVEKFLWEYLCRIVALILIIPVIFWLVYNMECLILSTLNSSFTFTYQKFFFIPEILIQSENVSPYPVLISMSIFVLTVSFSGASIFGRYPLLKTLFSVTIIFFFHLLLVYFFVEVLQLKNYNVSQSETQVYLVPTTGENIMRLFTVASFLGNILLTTIAYFKLKEKEV